MKQDVVRGYKRSPDSCTTRQVISFPDDMFAFLQAKARERNTNFNEQVLCYFEWGIESEENALANPDITVPVIRNLTRPERALSASKRQLRSGSSHLALASHTPGNEL